MSSPAMTSVAVAGVVLGASSGLDASPSAGLALAGFLGGIASIGFVGRPNVLSIVIALAAGIGAGVYVAPAVAHGIGSVGEYTGAIAFLLGLVAIPIAGGCHKIAMIWQADPLKIIRLFRGRRDGN